MDNESMALPQLQTEPTYKQQTSIIYKRSTRFFRKNSAWFYATREGADIGPFRDKAEAQMALVYFIERMSWPNEKQLRNFTSGKSAVNEH